MHTKEPWGINSTLEMVCDASGENIKSTPQNLRRIVACVNACAGIPTADLERVKDEMTPVFELLMQATKQRDELLVALNLCKFDSLNMSMEDLGFIRSVVAKVTQS